MSDVFTIRATADGLDLLRFVRGIGVRQVRIICGLILFAYLFSHLTNHALGNVSYEAMEAWLQYHMWWWRSPLGAMLLYTAATVHFLLGLWALYQRRHFRYWHSEIMQLLLGLSIPLLLVSHFVDVRLQGTLFNRHIYYAQSLALFWVFKPYLKYLQFVLLLVAWTHACIGLHFWLRLKRSYVLVAPFFRAAAVLLPAFAVLGLER
jgi:adenylate cyclase